MPDLQTNSNNSATATSLPHLQTWLNTPRASSISKEFATLRDHLHSIPSLNLSIQQRVSILDKIYTRSMSSLQILRFSLVDAPLPATGKVLQTIGSMQEMLDILAKNLVDLGDIIDKQKHEDSPPSVSLDLILWRSLYIISRHIIIGSLRASPPNTGVWRQLHQIYNNACLRKLNRNMPTGTTRSIQDIYYTAVLLGCAQPTSFTSKEIDFLDTYLERISNQIDLNDDGSEPDSGTFWIDPNCDAPATPFVRNPPAEGVTVRCFSCGRLSKLLKIQLTKLDSGASPEQVNLPKFAATPAGRSVLRRLIRYWGDPIKRRFPRRKQNYRGNLCIGLANICHLFHSDKKVAKVSKWIITSESPDGYTAMYDSGKTGSLKGGDVVALRTEHSKNWQICIIRRVLSENVERIELGLQILSPRVFAASLALPSKNSEVTPHPALFLPAIPSLRSEEALILPAGTLTRRPKDFALVIEKDNVEVREVHIKHSDEQNSQIEIYTIESSLPGNTKQPAERLKT